MGASPSGLTAKDPVESVPHEGPIDSSHGALSNAGGGWPGYWISCLLTRFSMPEMAPWGCVLI